MKSFKNNPVETVYSEVDSSVNIQEIIFKYITYWKWFILSLSICLAIGVFIYMRVQREYVASTAVLLKENSGSVSKNAAFGSLEELGLLSTTSNVDNEIVLFSSINLMRQVVLALELQTTYYEKGRFRNAEVYKSCPYYVFIENVNPEESKQFVELTLSRKDGNTIVNGVLSANGEKITFEEKIAKLPSRITLPENLGSVCIANRKHLPIDDSKEYLVSIRNAKSVAEALVQNLTIANATKYSSSLNIGLRTANASKGIDVLTVLVKKYNEDNIKENNQMAINTSQFIGDRLTEIGLELGEIESKIENYKKSQGIIDLSSETQLYMDQTGILDQKQLEVETQLTVVQLVDNFIGASNNKNKLIPNLGITDPGLAQIITEYNNSLIEYELLLKNTNENTPSRVRAEAALENKRNKISGSVQNVKQAILISKQHLDRQKALTASRIHAVPMQERDLLELMRQQQIKQTLYLLLLQTKEETSITMASTSDKAKVIADPSGSEYPVSPQRNIILTVAFLIGLALPILGVNIREYLKIHVNSKEELERLTNIPILGEIPQNESAEIMAVHVNATDSITELFRGLRNNIRFLLNDSSKKVILVTSTISNEGKTFISINLAKTFAFSSNRVLVIGMDLRNPHLAQDIGLKKQRGVTEYLAGQESDWKNLVQPSGEHPNLDVLQAGVIPPNPNELLMKPELNRLIAEAREIYDIIIIDSAPLGIISDTFLLADIPDVTLYVAREGATPKNAISFINQVYSENRFSNLYLVLNDVELSKNRYGKYNYKYVYGYNDKK